MAVLNLPEIRRSAEFPQVIITTRPCFGPRRRAFSPTATSAQASPVKYDASYIVKVSAETVLLERRAICSGYAELTVALLQALGIPTITVSGSSHGASGSWSNHAWNEAYVDGHWIIIDNTWGMKCFDADVETFTLDHHLGFRTIVVYDDSNEWKGTAPAIDIASINWADYE